jgi:hypothetical protein
MRRAAGSACARGAVRRAPLRILASALRGNAAIPPGRLPRRIRVDCKAMAPRSSHHRAWNRKTAMNNPVMRASGEVSMSRSRRAAPTRVAKSRLRQAQAAWRQDGSCGSSRAHRSPCRGRPARGLSAPARAARHTAFDVDHKPAVLTTFPYSTSTPMAPSVAARRPSAGARSNACRESARRPSGRRAADG